MTCNNSPGDRVADCYRWLEENPDAPLMDRAAFALVVVAGGDPKAKVSFGDVADLIGVPATDVLQGLLALRERTEASA